MKNKKSLIILIAILVLLIIVILIILNILNKNKEEEENIIMENPQLTTNLDINKLNNENEFFTVEQCINDYFMVANSKNSNQVYKLLNENYIKENSIDNTNVLAKTYQLKNGFEKFLAKDIHYREISYDREYQYYIFGDLLGEDYKSIQSIYIIANLDFENMTFNISFDKDIEISKEDYLSKIEDLKSGNTNEFIYVSDQDVTEIAVNEYNTFSEYISNDPYALQKYLDNYCTMAVYYPDTAYNLLDEEYRNKKFENIDEFKQYIDKNKSQLLSSTVSQYNISEKDGYTQYVIVDTNNNYYIFKVYGILDYKVLTDFYTIDLEEISNSYDERNTQEKVAINIQKIVSALNNKDYKYVYSKLDDEFKQNNYPSIEDFESYISEKFLGNRDIEFNNFYNEGSTYIYNITLNGKRASDGDPINMQIIMQLKDNRDFVMSFNIEE